MATAREGPSPLRLVMKPDGFSVGFMELGFYFPHSWDPVALTRVCCQRATIR